MRLIIIWFLFCAFIWFSILAIEGLMSYLGDRKRRKMKEKQFEIVMGKCPIEAGGNCPLKSQGECRTCAHRDPENKKCDCGELERAGCPFPVSDDYYCKYYKKGGAEK